MTIKKMLMIAGLILVSRLTLVAQNVKFGLVAGLDMAKPWISNSSNLYALGTYNPMLTFNVNGHIAYQCSGFLTFAIEPGFIQKGGKYEGSNTRTNLNYLQLPVMADLYVTKKIYVSVGPEFSYLISAKIKSGNNTADIIDNYDHKFEFSGLIGLSYTLSTKFDLGVRYSRGFTWTIRTVFTDENGIATGEWKEYNQYFQVLLRYKL